MLTQNSLSQERKRKLRWVVTISTMPLLGVLTAFGLVPQSDLGLPSSKLTTERIALPNIDKVTPASSFWRNERVQRGDTVDALLSRLEISDAVASKYLRSASETRLFANYLLAKKFRQRFRLQAV